MSKFEYEEDNDYKDRGGRIVFSELSEETKRDIRRLKRFSLYLVATPVILFLILVILFLSFS